MPLFRAHEITPPLPLQPYTQPGFKPVLVQNHVLYQKVMTEEFRKFTVLIAIRTAKIVPFFRAQKITPPLT